jgi:cation:H+ antiporter
VGESQATRVDGTGWVGRDLLMVLAGVGAMTAGAFLMIDALRRITGVEATQTRLGLTLVGFATGFELVVLAWSAARRGISEAVVAGVVGSFAYNVTMTLGAGALARPLAVADPRTLHWPLAAMIAALAFVVLLAARGRQLKRRDGVLLLAAYPAFVALVWLL